MTIYFQKKFLFQEIKQSVLKDEGRIMYDLKLWRR
jgi:hypothetical protein